MSKTKKAAAKKAPAKAAKPAANKPIKEALSKSGLVAHLAEASGVIAPVTCATCCRPSRAPLPPR